MNCTIAHQHKFRFSGRFDSIVRLFVWGCWCGRMSLRRACAVTRKERDA